MYLQYWRWLALGGLVCLYAAFSLSETSFFALSPLDRLRLKEQRPRRGKLVEDLLGQSHLLLITVILGLEITTILATILATSLALSLWGEAGKWVALGVLSPALLLLGEILPKSLALAYPARLAPLVAPVVKLAVWVLAPVRLVVLQISRGILVTLGFRPEIQVPVIQQEDFVHLVEESHQVGVIAPLERDFIQNVLAFGEVRVGQIMVPRPDIFCLPIDMPVPRLIEAVKRSRFSRVPIYQDQPGNVLGILHAKDLLRLGSGAACDSHHIRQLLRPPHYIPESKKAFDLLTELQNRRLRLALVVDEYGVLVGLITVEDLLEELCGEIPQEFAVEETPVEEVAPGCWHLKASLSVEDFNEALGTDLPAQEFDTIGGLVLDRFGELPQEGDSLVIDDLIVKVLKKKGTRLLELEVTRKAP